MYTNFAHAVIFPCVLLLLHTFNLIKFLKELQIMVTHCNQITLLDTYIILKSCMHWVCNAAPMTRPRILKGCIHFGAFATKILSPKWIQLTLMTFLKFTSAHKKRNYKNMKWSRSLTTSRLYWRSIFISNFSTANYVQCVDLSIISTTMEDGHWWHAN